MTEQPQTASKDKPARKGRGRVVRTGQELRGPGAMRDIHIPLNIDPRIDLTQPIYEQVLALEKADKEAADHK